MLSDQAKLDVQILTLYVYRLWLSFPVYFNQLDVVMSLPFKMPRLREVCPLGLSSRCCGGGISVPACP